MEDLPNTDAQMQGTQPTDGSLSSDTASKPFNLNLEKARRTAFIARFIVLREGKRTRAHRVIEKMEWEEAATAEELYQKIRQAFLDNQDNMIPVDRDLRRAYKHADPSHMVGHFVQEYGSRAGINFIQALYDYGRSNYLLFGDDVEPKSGGWRMPQELEKEVQKEKTARGK